MNSSTPRKQDVSSPTSSIFCRICHDRSPQSGLIAPCNCNGSITHVHRACLDHWLTESQTHRCELCGISFVCLQESPSFFQFIRRFPRQFFTDFFLVMFLTPMALVAILLCFRGAVAQFEWHNYVESFCLFCLGSFLSGVYLAWIGLTFRNHYKSFVDWRLSFPNLKLVWPQDASVVSTSFDSSRPNTSSTTENTVFPDGTSVSPQRRRDVRLRSANSPSSLV